MSTGVNTRIYQKNNKMPNFTKEINTEIIKQNTETVMVDNKYRNG